MHDDTSPGVASLRTRSSQSTLRLLRMPRAPSQEVLVYDVPPHLVVDSRQPVGLYRRSRDDEQ